MSGPNPPTESHALEQTVPAVDGLRRAEPSAEPLARGMAVGRYTVLDRIGAGGMGVVYSAFDPELDRRIALKVLHASGAGSLGDTVGRNRLQAEPEESRQALFSAHGPDIRPEPRSVGRVLPEDRPTIRPNQAIRRSLRRAFQAGG